METKKITIEVNVPADCRFIAWQPFGQLTLFRRKPEIVKDASGAGESVEYWGVQKKEIELIGTAEIAVLNLKEDWKKSLKEI